MKNGLRRGNPQAAFCILDVYWRVLEFAPVLFWNSRRDTGKNETTGSNKNNFPWFIPWFHGIHLSPPFSFMQDFPYKIL